jgi:hypothetical protein
MTAHRNKTSRIVQTAGAFTRRRREDDRAFEACAALGGLAGGDAGFLGECLQLLAEASDADLARIDVFAEGSDSRLVPLSSWRRGGGAQAFA